MWSIFWAISRWNQRPVNDDNDIASAEVAHEDRLHWNAYLMLVLVVKRHFAIIIIIIIIIIIKNKFIRFPTHGYNVIQRC